MIPSGDTIAALHTHTIRNYPMIKIKCVPLTACVFQDVSTTTWLFSGQPFSPRSVISVNGHNTGDDGLLRVRTDLGSDMLNRSNQRVQTSTYEVDRQTHLPALLLLIHTISCCNFHYHSSYV